jgi:peptidoglycan/LPS O-acetylase OafA/YrhL
MFARPSRRADEGDRRMDGTVYGANVAERSVGATEQAAATKRLVTVSVVQFFASVCILARHYSFFLEKDFPAVTAALSGITFTDYFFCCSGFFMHYVNARKPDMTVGPLVKKRFIKLYPLHLATTLFYVAILIASAHLSSLGGTRSGWECVLPTITLTHAFGTVDQQCLNYPSWFLSALFALTLAYPAIRWTINKFGAASVLALTVLIVVASEAAYRFGDAPHWSSLTYNFGILRDIPTFLAGILIAEYLPRIAPHIKSFTLGYAAFGAALIGMMTGLDPLICYGILPVTLVALLAGAEANGARSVLRNRRLAAVGGWSFPLYLLHVPIAAVLLNFAAVRFLHLHGWVLVGAALATAAVAIIASWIASHLLDALTPAPATRRKSA